jgi:Uma2 family endonuclease
MHTTPARPHPAGAPRPPRRATIEDWLAIPEERRAELVDGRIVYQSMPGPVHGQTQGNAFAILRGPYARRPGGGDRPGGWWLSLEVDLDIAGLGCRPDVLGWRRDRQASLPVPDRRGVVTAVPDWICEVLSPSTAHVDMGDKRLGYHRAGVAHYWLLDPLNGTLTVLRWTAEGYLVALAAGRGDKIRAAPFEEIEIEVSELFGADEDEDEREASEEAR